MLSTIKQVFKPKNRDILKKIGFTLAALFIFILGTTIVVPGIDQELLGTKDLGFLQLVNVMGGGAMEKFSIFSLGVIPYITASIIIQLLQMDIIPYLAELGKQGHAGQTKINSITRWAGIALAFIQGYMFTFTVYSSADILFRMQIALILTAGTAFLLWLGDQITQKGIGNGISILIMAGIIATMPTMFVEAYGTLVPDSGVLGLITFIIFVIIYFAIIIGIVYEQLSERRIPIQYANKSTAMLGKQNYIPFKLNSAGVIPVIFASTLISIPSIIAQFVKNDGFSKFVENWLTTSTWTGFILYIVCILAFAYFYTFLQLKPKELAENLNQNGGYIPGVRPGAETEKYIKGVLSRITTVGALALAVLAALPIVFGLVSNMPATVTIGGTSILIVVGVALETYKQLESQLLTRTYTTTKRGRRR